MPLGGELSMRHIPDVSDSSFSFQIPRMIQDDDIMAQTDADFFQGADITLAPSLAASPIRPTAAHPPSTSDPMTLSQLTPRRAARPKPQSRSSKPSIFPTPLSHETTETPTSIDNDSDSHTVIPKRTRPGTRVTRAATAKDRLIKLSSTTTTSKPSIGTSSIDNASSNLGSDTFGLGHLAAGQGSSHGGSGDSSRRPIGRLDMVRAENEPCAHQLLVCDEAKEGDMDGDSTQVGSKATRTGSSGDGNLMSARGLSRATSVIGHEEEDEGRRGRADDVESDRGGRVATRRDRGWPKGLRPTSSQPRETSRDRLPPEAREQPGELPTKPQARHEQKVVVQGVGRRNLRAAATRSTEERSSVNPAREVLDTVAQTSSRSRAQPKKSNTEDTVLVPSTVGVRGQLGRIQEHKTSSAELIIPIGNSNPDDVPMDVDQLPQLAGTRSEAKVQRQEDERPCLSMPNEDSSAGTSTDAHSVFSGTKSDLLTISQLSPTKQLTPDIIDNRHLALSSSLELEARRSLTPPANAPNVAPHPTTSLFNQQQQQVRRSSTKRPATSDATSSIDMVVVGDGLLKGDAAGSGEGRERKKARIEDRSGGTSSSSNTLTRGAVSTVISDSAMPASSMDSKGEKVKMASLRGGVRVVRSRRMEQQHQGNQEKEATRSKGWSAGARVDFGADGDGRRTTRTVGAHKNIVIAKPKSSSGSLHARVGSSSSSARSDTGRRGERTEVEEDEGDEKGNVDVQDPVFKVGLSTDRGGALGGNDEMVVDEGGDDGEGCVEGTGAVDDGVEGEDEDAGRERRRGRIRLTRHQPGREERVGALGRDDDREPVNSLSLRKEGGGHEAREDDQATNGGRAASRVGFASRSTSQARDRCAPLNATYPAAAVGVATRTGRRLTTKSTTATRSLGDSSGGQAPPGAEAAASSSGSRTVSRLGHSESSVVERGNTTAQRRQKTYRTVHPIPDFKALHAQHEATLALRKENVRPTIPLAMEFETDIRAKERAKFEEHVREKEAEAARIAEEERAAALEREEREVREMRKKAVPKANVVPSWYAKMPKRKDK